MSQQNRNTAQQHQQHTDAKTQERARQLEEEEESRNQNRINQAKDRTLGQRTVPQLQQQQQNQQNQRQPHPDQPPSELQRELERQQDRARRMMGAAHNEADSAHQRPHEHTMSSGAPRQQHTSSQPHNQPRKQEEKQKISNEPKSLHNTKSDSRPLASSPHEAELQHAEHQMHVDRRGRPEQQSVSFQPKSQKSRGWSPAQLGTAGGSLVNPGEDIPQYERAASTGKLPERHDHSNEHHAHRAHGDAADNQMGQVNRECCAFGDARKHKDSANQGDQANHHDSQGAFPLPGSSSGSSRLVSSASPSEHQREAVTSKGALRGPAEHMEAYQHPTAANVIVPPSGETYQSSQPSSEGIPPALHQSSLSKQSQSSGSYPSPQTSSRTTTTAAADQKPQPASTSLKPAGSSPARTQNKDQIEQNRASHIQNQGSTASKASATANKPIDHASHDRNANPAAATAQRDNKPVAVSTKPAEKAIPDHSVSVTAPISGGAASLKNKQENLPSWRDEPDHLDSARGYHVSVDGTRKNMFESDPKFEGNRSQRELAHEQSAAKSPPKANIVPTEVQKKRVESSKRQNEPSEQQHHSVGSDQSYLRDAKTTQEKKKDEEKAKEKERGSPAPTKPKTQQTKEEGARLSTAPATSSSDQKLNSKQKDARAPIVGERPSDAAASTSVHKEQEKSRDTRNKEEQQPKKQSFTPEHFPTTGPQAKQDQLKEGALEGAGTRSASAARSASSSEVIRGLEDLNVNHKEKQREEDENAKRKNMNDDKSPVDLAIPDRGDRHQFQERAIGSKLNNDIEEMVHRASGEKTRQDIAHAVSEKVSEGASEAAEAVASVAQSAWEGITSIANTAKELVIGGKETDPKQVKKVTTDEDRRSAYMDPDFEQYVNMSPTDDDDAPKRKEGTDSKVSEREAKRDKAATSSFKEIAKDFTRPRNAKMMERVSAQNPARKTKSKDKVIDSIPEPVKSTTKLQTANNSADDHASSEILQQELEEEVALTRATLSVNSLLTSLSKTKSHLDQYIQEVVSALDGANKDEEFPVEVFAAAARKVEERKEAVRNAEEVLETLMTNVQLLRASILEGDLRGKDEELLKLNQACNDSAFELCKAIDRLQQCAHAEEAGNADIIAADVHYQRARDAAFQISVQCGYARSALITAAQEGANMGEGEQERSPQHHPSNKPNTSNSPNQTVNMAPAGKKIAQIGPHDSELEVKFDEMKKARDVHRKALDKSDKEKGKHPHPQHEEPTASEKVMSHLSQLKPKTAQMMERAVHETTAAVSRAVDDATRTARDAVSDASRGTRNMVDDAKRTIRDVTHDARDAVDDAATRVRQASDSAADKARNFVDSLGRQSSDEQARASFRNELERQRYLSSASSSSPASFSNENDNLKRYTGQPLSKWTSNVAEDAKHQWDIIAAGAASAATGIPDNYLEDAQRINSEYYRSHFERPQVGTYNAAEATIPAPVVAQGQPTVVPIPNVRYLGEEPVHKKKGILSGAKQWFQQKVDNIKHTFQSKDAGSEHRVEPLDRFPQPGAPLAIVRPKPADPSLGVHEPLGGKFVPLDEMSPSIRAAAEKHLTEVERNAKLTADSMQVNRRDRIVEDQIARAAEELRKELGLAKSETDRLQDKLRNALAESDAPKAFSKSSSAKSTAYDIITASKAPSLESVTAIGSSTPGALKEATEDLRESLKESSKKIKQELSTAGQTASRKLQEASDYGSQILGDVRDASGNVVRSARNAADLAAQRARDYSQAADHLSGRSVSNVIARGVPIHGSTADLSVPLVRVMRENPGDESFQRGAMSHALYGAAEHYQGESARVPFTTNYLESYHYTRDPAYAAYLQRERERQNDPSVLERAADGVSGAVKGVVDTVGNVASTIVDATRAAGDAVLGKDPVESSQHRASKIVDQAKGRAMERVVDAWLKGDDVGVGMGGAAALGLSPRDFGVSEAARPKEGDPSSVSGSGRYPFFDSSGRRLTSDEASRYPVEPTCEADRDIAALRPSYSYADQRRYATGIESALQDMARPVRRYDDFTSTSADNLRRGISSYGAQDFAQKWSDRELAERYPRKALGDVTSGVERAESWIQEKMHDVADTLRGHDNADYVRKPSEIHKQLSLEQADAIANSARKRDSFEYVPSVGGTSATITWSTLPTGEVSVQRVDYGKVPNVTSFAGKRDENLMSDDAPVLSKVADKASSAVSSVLQAGKDAVNHAADLVDDVKRATNVMDDARRIATDIDRTGREAAATAKNVTQHIADEVKSRTARAMEREKASKAKASMNAAAENLRKANQDAAEGVAQGIEAVKISGQQTVDETRRNLDEAKQNLQRNAQHFAQGAQSARHDAEKFMSDKAHEFDTATRETARGIERTAQNIGTQARAKIDGAGQAIKDAAVDTQRKAESAGHRIGEAANTARDRIYDAQRDVQHSAKQAARSASDFASETSDSLRNKADQAASVTQQKATEAKQGAQHLASQAQQKASQLGSSVQNKAHEAKEKLSDIGSKAQNQAVKAGQAVKDTARSAADKASNTAHEMTDQVTQAGRRAQDKAQEIGSSVKNAAADASRTISKKAQDASESARYTAAQAAGYTKEAAADAKNKAQNVASDAQRKLSQAGRSIAGTAEAAKDKASQLASSAQDKAINVGRDVKDKASRAGQSIQENAKEAEQSAKSAASEAKDKATDIASVAREKLAQAGHAIAGAAVAAKDKIADFIGVASEKAHDATEAAKDKGSQAKDSLAHAGREAQHKLNQAGRATADAASHAKDKASEIASRTGEAAKRAGHSIQDKAEEAGYVVKDKASSALHATQDTAEQARQKAEQAARAAGRGISDAGHRVADSAAAAKDKVAHLASDAGHKAADTAVAAKDNVSQFAREAGHKAADTAAAAKDKVSNLATAAGHKVADTAVAAKDNVSQFARETGHKAADTAAAAKDNVSQFAREAGHKAADTAAAAKDNVSQFARETGHKAADTAAAAKDNVSQFAREAGHKAADTAVAAKDKVANLASAAGHKVADTAVAAKDKVSNFASEAGHKVADTATAAKDNVSQFAREAGHKAADTAVAAKDKVSNLASAAGHKVADTAVAAKDNVSQFAREAGHKVADTAVAAKDKAAHLARDAGHKVADTAIAAKDKAAHLASDAGHKVADTAVAAKDKVAHLASDAGHKVSETTSAAVEKAQEIGHAAKEKASEVKEKAVDIAHVARDKLSETGHAISDLASSAKDKVSHAVSDAGHAVQEKASQIGQAIAGVTIAAKDKVLDFVSGARDTVAAAGHATQEKAAQAGHAVKDVASKAGTTIKHAVEDAGEAARDTAVAAKDKTASAAEWAYDHARSAAYGVADGVKNASESASSTAQHAAASMRDNTKAGAEAVSQKAQQAAESVRETAERLRDEAKTKTANMMERESSSDLIRRKGADEDEDQKEEKSERKYLLARIKEVPIEPEPEPEVTVRGFKAKSYKRTPKQQKLDKRAKQEEKSDSRARIDAPKSALKNESGEWATRVKKTARNIARDLQGIGDALLMEREPTTSTRISSPNADNIIMSKSIHQNPIYTEFKDRKSAEVKDNKKGLLSNLGTWISGGRSSDDSHEIVSSTKDLTGLPGTRTTVYHSTAELPAVSQTATTHTRLYDADAMTDETVIQGPTHTVTTTAAQSTTTRTKLKVEPSVATTTVTIPADVTFVTTVTKPPEIAAEPLPDLVGPALERVAKTEAHMDRIRRQALDAAAHVHELKKEVKNTTEALRATADKAAFDVDSLRDDLRRAGEEAAAARAAAAAAAAEAKRQMEAQVERIKKQTVAPVATTTATIRLHEEGLKAKTQTIPGKVHKLTEVTTSPTQVVVREDGQASSVLVPDQSAVRTSDRSYTSSTSSYPESRSVDLNSAQQLQLKLAQDRIRQQHILEQDSVERQEHEQRRRAVLFEQESLQRKAREAEQEAQAAQRRLNAIQDQVSRAGKIERSAEAESKPGFFSRIGRMFGIGGGSSSTENVAPARHTIYPQNNQSAPASIALHDQELRRSQQLQRQFEEQQLQQQQQFEQQNLLRQRQLAQEQRLADVNVPVLPGIATQPSYIPNPVIGETEVLDLKEGSGFVRGVAVPALAVTTTRTYTPGIIIQPADTQVESASETFIETTAAGGLTSKRLPLASSHANTETARSALGGWLRGWGWGSDRANGEVNDIGSGAYRSGFWDSRGGMNQSEADRIMANRHLPDPIRDRAEARSSSGDYEYLAARSELIRPNDGANRGWNPFARTTNQSSDRVPLVYSPGSATFVPDQSVRDAPSGQRYRRTSNGLTALDKDLIDMDV